MLPRPTAEPRVAITTPILVANMSLSFGFTSVPRSICFGTLAISDTLLCGPAGSQSVQKITLGGISMLNQRKEFPLECYSPTVPSD